MSLLACFKSIHNWFNANVGNVGITVLVVVFSMSALLIFWNICKAAIGKKKLVIKWGQLILLILLVIVIVLLCLMY